MVGAAIVGAMAATLIIFALFALAAIGALSTSIAVGLYKKSFASGFKTFLLIAFGAGCSFFGGAGLFAVHFFFHLPLSAGLCVLVGGISGLIGGIIMAAATYHVFQWVIRSAAQRLRLAQ